MKMVWPGLPMRLPTARGLSFTQTRLGEAVIAAIVPGFGDVSHRSRDTAQSW